MEAKPNRRCPHFIKETGVCEYKPEGAVVDCLGQPSDGYRGCLFSQEMLVAAALKTAVQATRTPAETSNP